MLAGYARDMLVKNALANTNVGNNGSSFLQKQMESKLSHHPTRPIPFSLPHAEKLHTLCAVLGTSVPAECPGKSWSARHMPCAGPRPFPARRRPPCTAVLRPGAGGRTRVARSGSQLPLCPRKGPLSSQPPHSSKSLASHPFDQCGERHAHTAHTPHVHPTSVHTTCTPHHTHAPHIHTIYTVLQSLHYTYIPHHIRTTHTPIHITITHTHHTHILHHRPYTKHAIHLHTILAHYIHSTPHSTHTSHIINIPHIYYTTHIQHTAYTTLTTPTTHYTCHITQTHTLSYTPHHTHTHHHMLTHIPHHIHTIHKI